MKCAKIILTLFIICLILGNAFASTPITACGTYTTNGETYYLQNDINYTYGAVCIRMNGSNQILDGNGFSLYQDTDPAYTLNPAITSNAFASWVNQNLTIKNFNIINGGIGINSSGYTIEDINCTSLISSTLQASGETMDNLVISRVGNNGYCEVQNIIRLQTYEITPLLTYLDINTVTITDSNFYTAGSNFTGLLTIGDSNIHALTPVEFSGGYEMDFNGEGELDLYGSILYGKTKIRDRSNDVWTNFYENTLINPRAYPDTFRYALYYDGNSTTVYLSHLTVYGDVYYEQQNFFDGQGQLRDSDVDGDIVLKTVNDDSFSCSAYPRAFRLTNMVADSLYMQAESGLISMACISNLELNDRIYHNLKIDSNIYTEIDGLIFDNGDVLVEHPSYDPPIYTSVIGSETYPVFGGALYMNNDSTNNNAEFNIRGLDDLQYSNYDITLYNVTEKQNGFLAIDGFDFCSGAICSNLTYSGGDYLFTVTGLYGAYSVENNFLRILRPKDIDTNLDIDLNYNISITGDSYVNATDLNQDYYDLNWVNDTNKEYYVTITDVNSLYRPSGYLLTVPAGNQEYTLQPYLYLYGTSGYFLVRLISLNTNQPIKIPKDMRVYFYDDLNLVESGKYTNDSSGTYYLYLDTTVTYLLNIDDQNFILSPSPDINIYYIFLAEQSGLQPENDVNTISNPFVDFNSPALMSEVREYFFGCSAEEENCYNSIIFSLIFLVILAVGLSMYLTIGSLEQSILIIVLLGMFTFITFIPVWLFAISAVIAFMWGVFQ